ncbi:MAG: hypothetical protein XFASWVDF_001797 [Candidatus Fervidibacter sp.]|jgi:four helix bundle protein
MAERKDRLEDLEFYRLAMQLWELFWQDSEKLAKDFRGREIARQMVRCIGSIAANIEEGYGRGFGKEYPQFLRIARGSAREARGWYQRTLPLLGEETVRERDALLSQLIGMLTNAIHSLERKHRR